jgi:cell wall-associated NlpC family hydrolase
MDSVRVRLSNHPKRLVILLLIAAVPLILALSGPREAHAEGMQKEIIRIAEQYEGEPYGYGPGELTCSEYTRLVFGRATGVWMPADPDLQRFYGHFVAPRERGDLVLFREYGGSGVTHVGIYAGLDKYGNPELWHSSVYYGRVVKSDLGYINGYLYAKRIR